MILPDALGNLYLKSKIEPTTAKWHRAPPVHYHATVLQFCEGYHTSSVYLCIPMITLKTTGSIISKLRIHFYFQFRMFSFQINEHNLSICFANSLLRRISKNLMQRKKTDTRQYVCSHIDMTWSSFEQTYHLNQDITFGLSKKKKKKENKSVLAFPPVGHANKVSICLKFKDTLDHLHSVASNAICQLKYINHFS